jgi:hypothetical protein
VDERLATLLSLLGKPSCSLRLLSGYGMSPRFAKTESGGSVLSGEFGGGFNNRAKRIAHLAGILAIRVINAPQLVA